MFGNVNLVFGPYFLAQISTKKSGTRQYALKFFLKQLYFSFKNLLKSIKVHLKSVYKKLFSYILVDKISKLKNSARHKIMPLLTKPKTSPKTPKSRFILSWPSELGWIFSFSFSFLNLWHNLQMFLDTMKPRTENKNRSFEEEKTDLIIWAEICGKIA